MTHSKLNALLRSKLTSKKSKSNRLIGKCNDFTLALLVKEMNKNSSSIDPFISFVQCLNFSYSTRLQLGKKGRNKTVINAATILRKNWFRGANLSKIKPRQAVDFEKVELFRNAIKKGLKINFYSFTTKVFHQLNNQYPIIDSNVKMFMTKYKFSGRMNFSSPSRTYDWFYIMFIDMMEQLKWKKENVEKLDMAIWQFITDEKTKIKSVKN